MYVRRAKNGTPSVHPIRGDEMRALRKLRRERPNEAYVFVNGARRTNLGHKNIQHTVRYTELSPDRFRDFWRD